MLCAIESIEVDALETTSMNTNKGEEKTHNKSDEIRFVLDSGATEHMVNEKQYFECLRNIDPVSITVAKKNEKLIARQRGDISIKTFYDGDSKTKRIKDVLFVKELKCNLMSIRSLTKKGYKVVFENDCAMLMQ